VRTRIMKRLAVLAVIGGLIAAVHPESVLKSAQSAVAAGGELQLEGAEFSEGGTFGLVLLGALNEYTLEDVQANEDGVFAIGLGIPANVRPGQYQLVAYAADGDRAATLDVLITAVSQESAGQGCEGAEGMASGPTAEEMIIQRSTTGAGWGVIGLVIGLAGGLGLAMLRGAPARET
jgi:hypothetical protein